MTTPTLPRPAALAALLCCALFAGAAGAQGAPTGAAPKDKPPKAKAAPQMDFEKHYLVILRRGPSWTPEVTPEAERIQSEHIAHLTRMAETGKLVIAGPFGEQQDPTFRGMCLYKTGTLEEARKLAEEDPAVKTGRLKVEVMAWYTEKGYMAFPKAKPVK
ncbi:YciI family protein [Archangium lansingense]|uniref:YciI family protein n=1 Tax=Archangium lansingense TaxID=2995310 RepID=A0ABT4A6Q7_9BACT|nr:YciI family protein [Archangium lansinium]MCY1076674.1 YciI family protein [Archangium lansinium]